MGWGNIIINYLQRCKTIAEGNVNYMDYLFKNLFISARKIILKKRYRSVAERGHQPPGRPIKITVSDPTTISVNQ